MKILQGVEAWCLGLEVGGWGGGDWEQISELAKGGPRVFDPD